MAGLNKVMIIGNLGKDVELKYTQGNQPVATFSLATSESWTDKDGQRQERTEWHRVVVFGKLAELCSRYLSKGRQVYVEGRLQTRQWQDKDGSTRYTTEINARDVLFLGNNAGPGGGQSGGGFDNNSQYGSGNQYSSSQYGGGGQYGNNQYGGGNQYNNGQYGNRANMQNNAPMDGAPDFSADEEDNFPF